jgi:hypothetical protein
MYELRTGHTTESTFCEEWQTEKGVGYTFVVVQTNTPHIYHIEEFSYGIEITTSDGKVFDDDNSLVCGHGKTEKEAWDNFWETFDPTPEKKEETKQTWVVTLQTPYDEWYEPPKNTVFFSRSKALEYKEKLAKERRVGMFQISIQEIAAE